MTMPPSFPKRVGAPAAATASGAPSSGAADGFADLVAQLLGGSAPVGAASPEGAGVPGQPGIPTGSPGVLGNAVPPADDSADDSADDCADNGSDDATAVTDDVQPSPAESVDAWWVALPVLPLAVAAPVPPSGADTVLDLSLIHI